MHWTELVGWLGVSAGICVSIPQIVRIYQTGSSRDVAVWSYRLLVFVCLAYLVRAIAIQEAIFIVSNAINVFIASWVLVLKRRYG